MGNGGAMPVYSCDGYVLALWAMASEAEGEALAKYDDDGL